MDNIKEPVEICPVDVELELNGKPYVLKKWSLKVDAWVQARFGRNTLQLFENMTSDELGKLLFHLISNKKDFQAENTLTWDDDGVEIERLQTGPEKVMASISGSSKETEVANKLLECYGLSQPLIKQLTGDDENTPSKAAKKKKAVKKKAKRLTGVRSST